MVVLFGKNCILAHSIVLLLSNAGLYEERKAHLPYIERDSP